MALEGTFLSQLTSNFVSRLNFTLKRKKICLLWYNGGNSDVKNKTLKFFFFILTGKKMLFKYIKESKIQNSH